MVLGKCITTDDDYLGLHEDLSFHEKCDCSVCCYRGRLEHIKGMQ